MSVVSHCIVLCKSLCHQLVVNDKLLFTDDNFELMPVEGDIWPGNSAVITVVFRPTEPKHYQQVCNHLAASFGATSLCQEHNVLVHCVPEKTSIFYSSNKYVKNEQMLMIFGVSNPEKI